MPTIGAAPAKRIESLRAPCLCPKAPLIRVSIRWQRVRVPPCSPISFLRSPKRFADAAEEVARSRVMAGVAYPSDTRAGLDLGKAVAARVIEHLKMDGKKWEGAVPVGPGLWVGSNPGGVDDVGWKLFVLSSANQFRPGPPPAPDSPERAAEIAEVKNFKRTPVTNSKVFYWQFGQYGGPGVLHR